MKINDTASTTAPAAARALYEVQVGYDQPRINTQWLGNWTGVADSEVDAQNKALDELWEPRLDGAGLSPVYATRVKPRFVVAEHWGHIFVGELENITRWAYDRVGGELVMADVKSNGKWCALTKSAMDDLTESILDNDADGTPEDHELEELDVLPAWAAAGLLEAPAEVRPAAAPRKARP